MTPRDGDPLTVFEDDESPRRSGCLSVIGWLALVVAIVGGKW